MEDGKREVAVSMLPIIPEDRDSGRTYTCRVLNPAAPAGRQTSVTINVQRECPDVSLLYTENCNLLKHNEILIYVERKQMPQVSLINLDY